MKRIGKILAVLCAAALFLYLILFDYPVMKRTLIASQNLTNESEAQMSTEQEETQSIQTSEQDSESVRAQIPATQTVLIAGGIRESVYSDVYPEFRDTDHSGTLLFTNSHLIGDYEQMEASEFQELISAGWDYAIGGIDNGSSAEEWQSGLDEEKEEIRQRSAITPTVYFFESGEYQTEREAVLEEEGFTALYYSVEDAEDVNTDESEIRRICAIAISAESDLQEILNQAWSYDSIALYMDPDSDDSSASGEWSKVLAALDADERFSVVSQSDLLNSTQDYDADRANKVAAILEDEGE